MEFISAPRCDQACWSLGQVRRRPFCGTVTQLSIQLQITLEDEMTINQSRRSNDPEALRKHLSTLDISASQELDSHIGDGVDGVFRYEPGLVRDHCITAWPCQHGPLSSRSVLCIAMTASYLQTDREPGVGGKSSSNEVINAGQCHPSAEWRWKRIRNMIAWVL